MLQQLKQLVKKLNLVEDTEELKYILTKDEENEILQYELLKLKKHYAWRLAQRGCSEELIMLKIATKKFVIDNDELFKKANTAKNNIIIDEEEKRIKKEFEQKQRVEFKKRFTAKYVFNIIRQTSSELGKPLIVNGYNKHFITAVCYFLSNDDKFEEEFGYSFKKGLFIRGVTGVGKTHLVRCVAKNKFNNVSIASILDINDKVQKEGYFKINFEGILFLDDVGAEEAYVNNYGTRVSFFKTFIEDYYLAQKPFNKLFISTNLNSEEIEERYGLRVRSRLREMFNIIDVEGKDMRV